MNNSYIAGFFDGEGTITKTGKIVITNTQKYILIKISNHLLSQGIFNKITTRKLTNPKHNIAYDLRIYGDINVQKFMKIIHTQHQNKIDRWSKINHRRKLLEKRAEEIKKLARLGYSYRDIGFVLEVPFTYVGKIVRGEIKKYV